MKIPLWIVPAFILFVWGLLQYGLKARNIGTQDTRDLVYWFSERLFVLVAFVYIWIRERERIKWLRYLWVIIVFIVLAAARLIYLILVIFGVIQKNDLVALMTTIFFGLMAIIIGIWEKRSL